MHSRSHPSALFSLVIVILYEEEGVLEYNFTISINYKMEVGTFFLFFFNRDFHKTLVIGIQLFLSIRIYSREIRFKIAIFQNA